MKELRKSRHLFLVELEQQLKQKGEGLSSSDLEELREYRCFLACQLAYNQRFDYITLFENFVTGQITLEHFFCEFRELFREIQTSYFRMSMDVHQLSNFSMEFELGSKMHPFTDLINEIWDYLECIYFEELFKAMYDSNYQANGESTIALIEKNYAEIKKCLE